MSRTFAPITIDDLEKKIWERLGADGFIDEDLIKERLGKDLKVKFSFENFECPGPNAYGKGSLLGFKTLSNGMTYCGMSAGGDWEYPVFFIVYWDGKKLRGYVPTDGNPWNTTTKEAYGNKDVEDLKNAKKRWPEAYKDAESIDSSDFEADDKLMLEDILGRITPQEKPKVKKKPEARIKAMTFYGTGDEAYELFQEACHFCYSLTGLGFDKEAELVCNWAEEMAVSSKETWEEYGGETAKGMWG